MMHTFQRTHARETAALRLLLIFTLGLLLGACRSTGGPRYGGKKVEVKILIEGPEMTPREASAATDPSSVEGWILSAQGWVDTSAESRIQRLDELRRRGEPKQADALLSDLVSAIDKAKLEHIRHRETILKLALRNHVLIVEHAGSFECVKFNPENLSPLVVRLRL